LWHAFRFRSEIISSLCEYKLLIYSTRRKFYIYIYNIADFITQSHLWHAFGFTEKSYLYYAYPFAIVVERDLVFSVCLDAFVFRAPSICYASIHSHSLGIHSVLFQKYSCSSLSRWINHCSINQIDDVRPPLAFDRKSTAVRRDSRTPKHSPLPLLARNCVRSWIS